MLWVGVRHCRGGWDSVGVFETLWGCVRCCESVCDVVGMCEKL